MGTGARGLSETLTLSVIFFWKDGVQTTRPPGNFHYNINLKGTDPFDICTDSYGKTFSEELELNLSLKANFISPFC